MKITGPILSLRLLAVVGVATAIAVVSLIPAEIWAQPAVDQEYRDFDPNLVYASGGSLGSVQVTGAALTLNAQPHGTSAVTLLTTPLQRVVVAFDVTIEESLGTATPLRIGVWSPLNGDGYFVVFGVRPPNAITIDGTTKGGNGASAVPGVLLRRTEIGAYDLGTPYRIVLDLDRASSVISYQVFAGGARLGGDSVTPHDLPDLFQPVRLSLTASSASISGPTQAVVSNYDVKLLHERFWTSKVDDARAQAVLLLLAVAASLLVLGAIVRGVFLIPKRLPAFAGAAGRLVRAIPRRSVAVVVAAGATAIYVLGNAFLFRFAGHPFDMGGARVFAYVASHYGPVQLYYLPNIVSLAAVWDGTPFMEAGYPYGPLSTYLFTAIGKLYGVFVGLPSPAPGDLGLEAAIKSVNVLFGLADAALIYLVLGRTDVFGRWRLIASALFLFNPAVWFSMSVWGQTHVISLFFVLAAIALAESGFVTWSWLALIASCLTRPQMLVFGLLLGIVLLRKFDWRTNLRAISWAVVSTFLILLPLTIASSPSLPVDLVINNFRVQEAGGNDPYLTTVSQGAYSLWPLITALQGATSTARIYAPSLVSFIGPLSYQRTSQILTGLAMLGLVVFLLTRKREAFQAGRYIPVLAVGISAFLMLLTGIVSTHFLLALPILILCRRWLGSIAYLFVVVTWTVTTLVPMFGDMGTILTHQNLLLAPTFQPITDFFIHTYRWDRFITAGVVANLCVVVWLVWKALLGRHAPSRAAA